MTCFVSRIPALARFPPNVFYAGHCWNWSNQFVDQNMNLESLDSHRLLIRLAALTAAAAVHDEVLGTSPYRCRLRSLYFKSHTESKIYRSPNAVLYVYIAFPFDFYEAYTRERLAVCLYMRHS